ncbi:LacI family DNA-binding transcriptional regulator [Dactylosporangium vinaceum]|uniref:LacI family DNA-binding transcriptional regulator n=1 Tax=Dactylosporangium vinaceum TaxID=53362 RepID=A0ABV5M8H0_9ACTN|nr:LacI family DNA-binding transcriptional regulator [Dactylosporangium vinaceum]
MKHVTETTSDRRVTIRDVAAQTGLSIATVSRVLNGRANVAAETRDRVLQAMGGLGNRAPRRRGAGVPKADSGVYVRCPYVLTDYFGLIVSAVTEALDAHGMHAIVDAGESAWRRTDVLLTLTAWPQVTGAILILPPEPQEDLERLRDRGFPFVVLDPRTAPPRNIAAVSAANFAGARRLMSHLVELGHRRVGVLGGPLEWLAMGDRVAGYAAPLVAAGMYPEPDLLRTVTDPTVDAGRDLAAQLLDRPDRPTALVAFNDKMAVGALQAAVARGLRVPADLSIAGFDDIDVSRATSPMLTTVRQPLGEMGRMAVSLLSRMLAGQDLDALHIELATELVIRGSTGPAPA